MRISCFDTDFASQMKLTKFPLLPPASEGWGKVLFSVCQSIPRRGGGGTRSSLGGGSRSSLGWGGTRSSLGRGGVLIQPWMGGYPNLGWGVPHLQGVPQPWTGGYPISGEGVPHLQVPPPPRNSKQLLRLRGGRCASCVHAGGLSCIKFVHQRIRKFT